MNPILTVAVAFLAVFALLRASIVEPTDTARTRHQYGAALRHMKWWHPPYWIAAVVLAVPLFTALSACRFVLYLLSFLAAALSVRLATATAMDGRRIRLYRLPGWREVPS